jgi:hypothetical protein
MALCAEDGLTEIRRTRPPDNLEAPGAPAREGKRQGATSTLHDHPGR